MKIEDLLKIDEENPGSVKIVLPNFQRQFVWKVEAQKELLCSLLAGVPIGSFLIQYGIEDDFIHRPLCYDFYSKKAEKKSDRYFRYLLDGQQRLSTIKSVVSDIFDIDYMKSLESDYFGVTEILKATNQSSSSIVDELLKKKKVNKLLRNRWFINLSDWKGASGNSLLEKLFELFDEESIENEPDDYDSFVTNIPIISKSNEKIMGLGSKQITEEFKIACEKRSLLPLWILQKNQTEFRDIAGRILNKCNWIRG